MEFDFSSDEEKYSSLSFRKVVLERIASSRIDVEMREVCGLGEPFLEIGRPFNILSTSLNGVTCYKHIKTSPVTMVNWVELNKIQFQTENSIYELEYLG